jgi:hypothetical protein
MCVCLCLLASEADAAEGAVGFYLLGSRTSMAGFLPPPGTYVQDNNYFYGGSTSATLEYNGAVVSSGVDAQAYYNLPTALFVAPGKVMGGNIAFNVITPIGWKNVDARKVLTGPGGAVLQSNAHAEEAAFGDPVLGSTVGWHEGNWHWSLGTLVNVPLGFWERSNLASIGFNHWAIDTTGAVTWLNLATGLELSGAMGFTYNFENPTTDYKTGTEFHLEFAGIQNLSKTFGIGFNGYFYDQITGDSGSGAKLGAFEGRVFGIGPAANLNIPLGQVPIAVNLKYFHELDVRNRLQGDSGYLTLTMPLQVSSH